MPTKLSSASKKRGNPAWVKGKSPNPSGRPPGALSKFSGWKLAQLLDIWGEDVPKLARTMMRKALDDENKDQLGWAKLVAERIFPASKAIEVTGLGGRAMELNVLVNGIKTFTNERIIEGEAIESSNHPD